MPEAARDRERRIARVYSRADREGLLGNLWKRPSVVERDKMSRVVDWCALVWGDEAADIGDGRV